MQAAPRAPYKDNDDDAYYNYENPSVCLLLVQMRAIVLKPQRNGKFEQENKNEMNSGSCSQMSSS